MDIHSKSMDGFIEHLSKKHGLTKKEVRNVIQSQFEFIKVKMRTVDSYNDHWPYIRLPLLGVFKIKPGKKRFFRNKSLKNIEHVYSDTEQ